MAITSRLILPEAKQWFYESEPSVLVTVAYTTWYHNTRGRWGMTAKPRGQPDHIWGDTSEDVHNLGDLVIGVVRYG